MPRPVHFFPGPPQMAEAAFDNNTDQGLYDVFGRSYRLALYARF